MDLGLSNSPPNNNRVGGFLLNEERYYHRQPQKALLHKRWTSGALTRAPPALPISLKVAKNERFILLDPQRNARIAFNHMVREVGFSPCIAIEAYNSDIALEYVEAGLGVALLAKVSQNGVPFPLPDGYAILLCPRQQVCRTRSVSFYDTDSTFTYAQQYLVDLVLTRFHSKSATNWEDSTTHTNAIG